MSILLNNRIVEVILKQNAGDTAISGSELDLSPYLLTLGKLSWSVDENLTKLSLGNLSITCTDDSSNTVWTFISNNLSSSYGILPAWLILNIDGVQRFIGIIKESPTRTDDAGTLEITINAVDWSSMLESKRIKAGDDTAMNRLNTFKIEGAWAAGTTIICESVLNKELRRNHDRATVLVASTENANFRVNDWVYFYNYNTYTDYNKKYQIVGKQVISVTGIGIRLCLYLANFQWLEHPVDLQNYNQGSTLYRVYQSVSTATEILPTFIAAESFTVSTAGANPKTTIKLDKIGGLQPGDVLNKITNFSSSNDPAFSVTIVDIDPVTSTIYLSELLNNDLVSGITSFEISEKSLHESVLVPIMPLLGASLQGLGTVDYTSYNPATLPNPCFSFISPLSPANQNIHNETLSAVQEIQPNLTGFDVLGALSAWTGLPSVGWDTTSWTKYVNWTEQRATAPAYLMPFYSLPALAPADSSPVRGYTRYPGLVGYDNDVDTSPTHGTSGVPVYKYVYDYSNLRYYQFTAVPTISLMCETWNGSTWLTTSGFSLTGIGNPIQIVPFKDTISSVGSGYGLLALYSDGTIKTILSTVSYTATLKDALDPVTNKLQVILKQTSNGIYYLTPNGYGKIEIISATLKTSWVQIVDSTSVNQVLSISPISSTFVYANSRILTLAKVSYKKSITDERTIDDTYLFQLNPIIQARGEDSVYSKNFIVSNIPRATMAVKSPVSEDVLGFMGGRLFQINKTLPDTVERFTSINQSPQAIMEFICSITNSVAIPLVSGIIKLYSRGYNKTPINVTIDQVSNIENRWNKHLASCVVIKGSTDDKGIAVSTTQLSGLTISYSNDVWIRNGSQAQAIAESYLAFFEKARREITQEWFSTANPAPWESLDPMQVITINGGSTQYYLTGLSYDLDTLLATVNLLEVV